MRLLITALTGALAILPSLQAQTLPKGVQKITSLEGLTEYRLENGLQIVLFPDQSKPKVTVNVTYRVGSKHENYGETGMAHLLEHLVFKGTKTRGNLMTELTGRGANFNGSTFLDRTNYFETVTASDDNLKWAIEMEADRMVNSNIAKSDLDTEMTVVRNEFERGENSPFRVTMQRAMALAFNWHNYGKSTIGARSDIENVPIDRLQAFYRKYYQPDNALLVVAGKFEDAKALAWIAASFGAIPRPTRKLEKTYTEEPTQDGEHTATIRRVGDIQIILAMYHVPSALHPDSAAMEVLNTILTDSPTGRIYKAMVDNKKAASVMGGSFDTAEPGLFMIGATLRKEQSLEEAKSAMYSTIEGAAKEPPNKEEVDRAKAKIQKHVELAMADTEQIGITLSEALAGGDWRLLFVSRDRVKKVTPEDVQRVAQLYLKTDNRSVAYFVPTDKPDRTEVPATPTIEAAMKDYVGEATVAAGEVFDTSPANIDARTQRSKLPNGLSVVLLPKKNKGGTVFGRLSMRVGSQESLKGRELASSLVGQMLMRGTLKHNRQQIQEELDRLKATLNVSGSGQSASMSFETTRPNLAAVLKLAAEILREPAFPDSEFDQIKTRTLAGIESQRREPQALAGMELQRILNPYPKGDIRYMQTFDESVEEVNVTTLAMVKKTYEDLWGCSAATFAMVGDFDSAEVQVLAKSLFGDWKSKTAYQRVTRGHVAVKAVNKMIETPDKANATFTAGMRVEIDDEDPDQPALMLGNFIFGGNPASRIWERLRQKEGLTYGTGSRLSTPIKDKGGEWTASAILAPQNIKKLEAAFKEELAKILSAGVLADEVEKAKKTWLQEQGLHRSEDRALLASLATNEYYGRTFAHQAANEKKVDALTAEQITAALRKRISLDNMTIVKAGDFKKAGTSE